MGKCSECKFFKRVWFREQDWPGGLFTKARKGESILLDKCRRYPQDVTVGPDYSCGEFSPTPQEPGR